jgi:hypothetical protein
MRKWITAKLQLLLGFIFLPVTNAIANLKEDLGTSLVGIDDLLMGLRVHFTRLNLNLLGGKDGEIEKKGLLDYLPLIYNKPNTVLFLNSIGKLFGLDESLRFNVVYDYAAEALRFTLLKGQAPVETCSLLLSESKIQEEHADYKALEWGRMILKSPRKVVGIGEKQISYCDDMAREAMRLLGNHILLTNSVITTSDLWAICNQAFFNDMRYFYAKEEEKNKAVPVQEASPNLKLVDLSGEMDDAERKKIMELTGEIDPNKIHKFDLQPEIGEGKA